MFAPGSCGCVCVCVRQADTDSDAGALGCPHQEQSRTHAGHVVWRRDRCTCGAGDGLHLPCSVLATGSACVLTSPLNLPATTPQHPISSIPNPPSRPSSPRVSPWPSTSYVDPPPSIPSERTHYPTSHLNTTHVPTIPLHLHPQSHLPFFLHNTHPLPITSYPHFPSSPSSPALPPPSAEPTYLPRAISAGAGPDRRAGGQRGARDRELASIDAMDGAEDVREGRGGVARRGRGVELVWSGREEKKKRRKGEGCVGLVQAWR